MPAFERARRIAAIAQTGLAYARDPYDLERYRELQALAAELLEQHLEQPAARLLEVLRLEQGYPTPKVDVRAAVWQQDRILLTRERLDGRWSLPGGWADADATPGEMAARETLEETGYVVRPRRVLAVWDKAAARHGHPPDFWAVYKIVLACDLEGGAPRESTETDGVGFFGLEELPALSESRVTEAQLRRLFELRQHPEWGTDFD
ncbi:ADP-ribose pyrophosphatase YjhB (NUDIX family) [Deinobacterium chartae]|uniref:ADP-ribose pyrophosphatase YjhB (NUDIX family) n=1 Tax=Deinobacterium chartae TaxID=521158 RepID=A0A841HUX8_9DEIO|nr:NUDIX hydrolase [Deinobacterium chartae]MBB6097177.1 ADP-ribose pyrophosphatase YjhB (NUDIX family) [Deinobacterium chartae]